MLQGWGQDIFSFKSVCVCVWVGGGVWVCGLVWGGVGACLEGGRATGPGLNSNSNGYCDVKITPRFRKTIMQIRSTAIS